VRTRILFGPVLIALLVLGLWGDEVVDRTPWPGWLPFSGGRETLPPGVVIFLVVVPISWQAARELAAMLRAKGIAARKRVTSSAALIGLLVSGLVPSGIPGEQAAAGVSSAAIVVLVGSLLFYSRRRTIEGVLAAAAGTLLAFVYLGLMFGFVLVLRREHTAWVLLWVLVTTKSCDIGAYFTGSAIGRHKLIEWLSPKKTWEGLAGGVLTSGVVGAGGAWILHSLGQPGPTVWAAGWLGAVFGVVGQLGDLLASLFKRDARQKDAGDVLPGFGGVIDVLDSPLLVMPVAFWLLTPTSVTPAG